MTTKELRELDSRIEREILGRCPHPIDEPENHLYADGFKCPVCGAYLTRNWFEGYVCPEYHKDWNAVMGSLVPEMEKRGFMFTFRDYPEDGQTLAVFHDGRTSSDINPRRTHAEAMHEDGRIAIVLCALKAVEREKQQ